MALFRLVSHCAMWPMISDSEPFLPVDCAFSSYFDRLIVFPDMEVRILEAPIVLVAPETTQREEPQGNLIKHIKT